MEETFLLFGEGLAHCFQSQSTRIEAGSTHQGTSTSRRAPAGAGAGGGGAPQSLARLLMRWESHSWGAGSCTHLPHVCVFFGDQTDFCLESRAGRVPCGTEEVISCLPNQRGTWTLFHRDKELQKVLNRGRDEIRVHFGEVGVLLVSWVWSLGRAF